MPIYEYACSACGHQFEEWQKMSDKPVRTCPKCKAKKVEKLISQTSFTLKGGGWYADLYAGPKPAASGEKSDSKSDAKAESTSSSDASGMKESKDSPAKPADTKKAAKAEGKKKTGAA